MELRELNYITAIGKTRHMTHAANELYISQPALYKSLRKIEAEFGTSLFYRKGNELLPTDTGEIVLQKAGEISALIAQMNDSVAATKHLKQGKVSIGFPSIVGTMYLPNLLTNFSKNIPVFPCTLSRPVEMPWLKWSSPAMLIWRSLCGPFIPIF